MNESQITQDQLEIWVLKWQERLGLRGWHIKISFRNKHDLEGNPAASFIQKTTQNVSVRVLHPKDRQKSDAAYDSIELDIIHELLHVRLWALDVVEVDDTTQTLKEQAFDWIARAMLASERREILG